MIQCFGLGCIGKSGTVSLGVDPVGFVDGLNVKFERNRQ